MAQPSHPYFPRDAAIPNYAPNISTTNELLVRFAAVWGCGLLASLVLLGRVCPRLSRSDKAVFLWFILCGSLHCFFEGYFVRNHKTLASSQGLLAQLWKEYALSDSRYLTSDPFVLCVEAITVVSCLGTLQVIYTYTCLVFSEPRNTTRVQTHWTTNSFPLSTTMQTVWGPLSFATALSVARTGPWRHPLQIIVSVAHLYGVALYYSTCYAQEQLNGVAYSRPEFQYYWVYYVGFNAPWVIVPAGVFSRFPFLSCSPSSCRGCWRDEWSLGESANAVCALYQSHCCV
ncbi:Emopamil binding protein-domain-containing protein [Coniella lustricola]|uniref:Emopamil binding protein-domain-containing protein n=1 Tax=Coniella lustricola TaxID=2025994 RepID=A0A2T3A689_9PEZI|nr:Emopamil binding protein-domain-containing protein [Coniella lustricola]